MKKMAIVLASAFVLMAVILIGFMVYMINRGEIGAGTENIKSTDLKLVNTQQVNLNNIDSINIKFYSDEVVFLASDKEELVLKEYKTYTPKQEELASISTSDHKLSIKGKEKKFNFFSAKNHHSRAEIYLPKQYAKKLSIATSSGDITSELVISMDTFMASSSSGLIRMNEILANEIQVSTTSGNIMLQKAEGNRTISSSSGSIKVLGGKGASRVESSSGTIYIEKSTGDLVVSSSSGDIKINGSVGKKELNASSGTIFVEDSSGIINASTTSGAIKIEALDGGGRMDTASGGISLSLQKLTSSITMNASSGDIKLTLPESESFQFTASSSSGKVKTDFDDVITFDKDKKHANGVVGEGANYNIALQTSSGNIAVMRN